METGRQYRCISAKAHMETLVFPEAGCCRGPDVAAACRGVWKFVLPAQRRPVRLLGHGYESG